jgi:hypothetical protein
MSAGREAILSHRPGFIILRLERNSNGTLLQDLWARAGQRAVFRQGHRIHVCKGCQSLPKSERRAIEDRDDIFGFMHQSHISKKNVARLEQLAKSDDARVASLAAIVLEVARVTPYRRRRIKILGRNHRDLLRKLGETGLVFAHTWDCVPPEVFGETHLEETDVFVEEGKTGLLAAEDSKTTDLPDPKDWRYRFEPYGRLSSGPFCLI